MVHWLRAAPEAPFPTFHWLVPHCGHTELATFFSACNSICYSSGERRASAAPDVDADVAI